MDQEEKGISFAQLLKILFGRKWVLLVAIIVTLIVGILFGTLYYNNKKVVYTTSYTYVSDDLSNGAYADGSSYNYNQILNLDVFNEIKKSDDSFEKLDVDKIYNSSAITINETREQIQDNSDYNKIKISYSLSTLKSYYPSYEVAQMFIEKLSQYPIEKQKTIIDSLTYNAYLNSYANSNTYEQKVNLLLLQKELLDLNYEKLSKLYGDVVVGDTTVDSSMNNFKLYFQTHSLEELLNQIAAEGFILTYQNVLSELKVEKNALELKKSKNEEKIVNLQNQIQVLIDKVGTSNISSVDLDAYNEKISALTLENVDIDFQISVIDKKIANNGSTDSEYVSKITEFETVMNNFYLKLKEFTDEYKYISTNVEENNTYILYSTSNILSQTGGLNILIIIVASLVFGLIIGCVINLCLDHNKFSEEFENKGENNE